MRVLFVTISYPPFKIGGTEVYVQGLCDALMKKGIICGVAFPITDPSGLICDRDKFDFKGVDVFPLVHKSFNIINDKFIKIFKSLFKLIDFWRPDLVHFHPLTLPVFLPWLQIVNKIPVVFTFHSSTTTCLRGDLLWHGFKDCAGVIDRKTCVECFQLSKGLPRVLAGLPTFLPDSLLKLGSKTLRSVPFTGKVATYLETPLQVRELKSSWDQFVNKSSRVVAVCHWVRETILKNGVSPDKVFLCRHGIRDELISKKFPDPKGKVIFGFLGRLWPEKGIEVLVCALRMIDKNLDFEFQFCSSTFKQICNQDFLVELVQVLVKEDSRIKILGHIPDEQMASILGNWDALLVPSLWFESGPQVVYESFNVGTPVIGSNRGGISELVEHEKTGLLVPPGDPIALCKTLVNVVKDPNLIRKLRSNISPVRTMSNVADDMISLYKEVLEEYGAQS